MYQQIWSFKQEPSIFFSPFIFCLQFSKRKKSNFNHVSLVRALFTCSSVLLDRWTFLWPYFLSQTAKIPIKIKQFHQKHKLIKLNHKWKEVEPKKLSKTENKEIKPFNIKWRTEKEKMCLVQYFSLPNLNWMQLHKCEYSK